jgi:hypothetical protein
MRIRRGTFRSAGKRGSADERPHPARPLEVCDPGLALGRLFPGSSRRTRREKPVGPWERASRTICPNYSQPRNGAFARNRLTSGSGTTPSRSSSGRQKILIPWESLHWETVRVIRYRQRHPNGEIVEAYGLTNLPSRRVSRRCLYAMAKSRWRIENQGLNDAQNRYGREHICDHHPDNLLRVWLLTCWALTRERLDRLRDLHWSSHPALAAIDLFRILLLTLFVPALADSS